jgi:Type I phosphodiesterase / nucleotide pyrophosphatase
MRHTLALLALIGLTTALIAADGDAPKKPKVKLAVVVFFDQMRGDYVEKWQPYFGEAGFKRLQNDGAWFTDCHYPYGTTTTAPGHASVLAGCGANKHGIINNNWFDRASGKDVYSSGSDRYEMVPYKKPVATATTSTTATPTPVGNPDRMIGPTLADVLRESTAASAKIFGLSLKDRSAILPTGRKPTGAYWFNGQFSTSTYYRDSLPVWVQDFNKSGVAESYFNKPWTRLRDDLKYDDIVGIDDGPGEGAGITKSKRMGKVFPHPVNGGKEAISAAYYEDMVNSPYGNDLLLAFAKECITQEKLGQRNVPDLLTISFSSNDLVGHTWGPDSHEVFDMTLRSDLILADLMKFLDDKVGAGNYSLIVTSDHGICPLPEAAALKKLDAKRISPTTVIAGADEHLRQAYGAPAEAPDKIEVKPEAEPKVDAKDDKAEEKKPKYVWVEAISYPNLYLNRKQLTAKELPVDLVAEKLAAWVRTQPGIDRAYTQKQLLGDVPKDDIYFVRTRNSFHPERSGDVVVVTKPYHLLDIYATGTTHGSPHEYDTHTVFLAYGPGIAGGKRPEKITPLHACPITADFLGLNPPRNNEYGLPTTLAKP